MGYSGVIGAPQKIREEGFMRGFVMVIITYTILNFISAILSITKKGKPKMSKDYFLSD
jgi:hypothetical protein